MPYGSGTSQFSIAAQFPDGTAAAPSIIGTSDPNTGIYWDASNRDQIRFSAGGTVRAAIIASGVLAVENGGEFAIGASQDVRWFRDAAGTSAFRNGTNAQSLRVYNSDSAGDDSFYEIDNRTTVGTCYQGPRATGAGASLVPVMIGAGVKTLTESAATGFVSLSVATSEVTAGHVDYTIIAKDATNTQAVTGQLFFSAVANSSGVVTAAGLSDQHVQNPVSAGTLTNTMTQTTAANLLTLLANAVSSLTQTTLQIRYRVVLSSGTATVTAL